MRNRNQRAIPPRYDIVTDVARLLDAAGIDGIQRRNLDDLLHSGVKAQALVDFADAMHRRTGCRIGYAEFIAEFNGAGGVA